MLTQRAQALTQHAQALTQRARSEAPMQRAGASTQHAGARGVDAGRGADAGPGGGQLEHRLALGAREGDGKWNPPTRVCVKPAAGRCATSDFSCALID